jgi:hypothetical protein
VHDSRFLWQVVQQNMALSAAEACGANCAAFADVQTAAGQSEPYFYFLTSAWQSSMFSKFLALDFISYSFVMFP